eukprot:CAMPEP_0117619912 /NCGR_PEP_ID=MMETSP0784-20121206/86858_1 /TAXON_ID=39447 /ORGANISM="" /LENGTH=52 /DNA_ID=CAMNT_0005423811 /DNA_START=32 /DNA_END=187 /DNA_ORIENTATION=-
MTFSVSAGCVMRGYSPAPPSSAFEEVIPERIYLRARAILAQASRTRAVPGRD